MNIQVNTSNMLILECFSTETRVRMIELLSKQPMNISQLAEALGLLAGLIRDETQAGR